MPLEASNGITVKSGINRVTLGYEANLTISELYRRCSSVLNLEGTNNLNVVVDDEQYDYASIETDVVEPSSVVEFIKKAGTKGN